MTETPIITGKGSVYTESHHYPCGGGGGAISVLSDTGGPDETNCPQVKCQKVFLSVDFCQDKVRTYISSM
jgi:hypothetical protein